MPAAESRKGCQRARGFRADDTDVCITVLRLRGSDQPTDLEVNFVFELPAERFARRRGAHTEQNASIPFEATGPDV